MDHLLLARSQMAFSLGFHTHRPQHGRPPRDLVLAQYGLADRIGPGDPSADLFVQRSY